MRTVNDKNKKAQQYVFSIVLVLLSTLLCFPLGSWISYRAVALILLLTVSLNAILFDILPVLISASLSALVWNFFFIPPVLTFHIGTTEDSLMFIMYFAVALVNTVLTFKIKRTEKQLKEKEEKEKTIQLYDTLLNSLSHELRTPITTIIGATDILKDQQNVLNSQQIHKLLEEIEKAGLRLNKELENLLNISRLESGMLHPQTDWCDLNELIASVIQKTEIPEKRAIIFESDESLPFFRLDAGFTEQIIYNLLHNAMQHGTENTTVRIRTAHATNYCEILIADNGGGFPEQEINKVFEKFYRLQHSKTGGTGLGLSIVKGFVEAQGGTIHLSNNTQGGADFLIRIPVETSYINHLKHE